MQYSSKAALGAGLRALLGLDKERAPFPPFEDRVARPIQPKYGETLHQMLRPGTDPGALCAPDTLGGYEDAPVLMVCRPNALDVPRHWLEEAGFEIAGETDFHKAANAVCRHPADWGLVIVSIDDFGGITEVIEGLRRMRRSAVRTPLILVSAEVCRNDFSTERLVICDVTLKAPVTFSALEIGLTEALVNNSIWQSRVEERFAGE